MSSWGAGAATGPLILIVQCVSLYMPAPAHPTHRASTTTAPAHPAPAATLAENQSLAPPWKPLQLP